MSPVPPDGLRALRDALSDLLDIEVALTRLAASAGPDGRGFSVGQEARRLENQLPRVKDIPEWQTAGLSLDAAVAAHERLARTRARARALMGE
jgi:hypothetical protein